MPLGLLWLVPLLPLIASAVNGLMGRRMGRSFTNLFAVGSVWASFVIVLLLFLTHSFAGTQPNTYPDIQAPFDWFDAGSFHLKIGLLLDPLSVVMALIVTGVGALIHTYSTGYMQDDPDYNRYFAYLNLFTFSMLMLVLGDSFLVLFVGWELVGLCSYLLIGFWYGKQSATDAGKKAFIVNRIGDWAFVIGVILTFVAFVPLVGGADALRFQPIFSQVVAKAASGDVGGWLTLVPLISLLLFIGATGKSAQLPLLHVWLPDAMEGPTPVSALIHAATMVTAGVYMVARCHDFFMLSPDVMVLIQWVGVLTAFVAATTALAQTDIKRVLAYSTISQLGYMFLAAGVGAFSYSIFHLLTHAFFKALLFLGAGAVIHALHNEQDMRKMGGLSRHMKWVPILMFIGVATISGCPPFSGFFSKDMILGKAAEESLPLWIVGTVTAFITAFYMFRLWFMTFGGSEHWQGARSHSPEPGQSAEPTDAGPSHDDQHDAGGSHGGDLHETPMSMLWPMAVLAVLSVVAGALAIALPNFLDPVFKDMAPLPQGQAFLGEVPLMFIAFLVFAAGAGVAYWMYGKRNEEPKPWMKKHPSLLGFLRNAWYIDTGLHTLFARWGEHVARVTYEDVDVIGIDRTAVHGLAAGVARSGRELRIVQSGVVGDYALAMAGGVVAVIIYFLTR